MTESRIRPEWIASTGLISAILPEPPYVQKYRGAQSQDLEAQYEQATSEAAFDGLLASGVNLVYLRFFAGYGLEFEKQPMERTHELIQRIQARGMKAGLLISFGALTLETLLLEEPDAHNWLQYNTDGKHVVTFSAAIETAGKIAQTQGEERASVSVRVRPCYHSENYLRAMERVCSLALDFGADLIHFDEFGFNPEPDTCRCPSCIASFREFLRDQYGIMDEQTLAAGQERFGHNSFAHVRPPAPSAREPFSGPHDTPHDQEWIRFKIATLSEALRRISRHIFKRSPSCAVGVDLFKHFGWESEVLYGLSAEALMPLIDVARIVSVTPPETAEDASSAQNQSENADEKNSAAKRARAKKLRREEKNEPSLFAENNETQRALRLDTAAFSERPADSTAASKISSHILWLPLAALAARSFEVALERAPRVRNLEPLDPVGQTGDAVQTGDEGVPAWVFNPRSLGGMRSTGTSFYQRIKEALAGSTPLRSIAIFQDTASLTFGDGSAQEIQNRVQQGLIEERATFEPLHETQPQRLAEYRCVVLAGCECLSNEAAEALTRFVENGGELLALGPVGVRDPWRRIRSTPALQHLADASRKGVAFLPATALDELLSRLRVYQLWDLETSSRRLWSAGYRCESLLHILLANGGQTLQQVRGWLRCEQSPVRITIQNEYHEDETPAFTWENGRVSLTLPCLVKNSQTLLTAHFEP